MQTAVFYRERRTSKTSSGALPWTSRSKTKRLFNTYERRRGYPRSPRSQSLVQVCTLSYVMIRPATCKADVAFLEVCFLTTTGNVLKQLSQEHQSKHD